MIVENDSAALVLRAPPRPAPNARRRPGTINNATLLAGPLAKLSDLAAKLSRPLLALAHLLLPLLTKVRAWQPGARPRHTGAAVVLLSCIEQNMTPDGAGAQLAGVLATPFRALWELCWALLPKRANLERNFVQVRRQQSIYHSLTSNAVGCILQGNITKIAKGVSKIKTQAGSSMGGQGGDSDDGLGPPPSQGEWWTDRGKAE
jgi:hypothetical protein